MTGEAIRRILSPNAMTSRSFLTGSLGLALGLLPLTGVCQQDPSSPPPTEPAVMDAVAAQPPPDSAAGDFTMSAPDIAAAPLPDATTTPLQAQKPPPNIPANSPVAEVVRLANSGLDQGVMLAFVTNSPNTFNLTADQIIYLNDIGVPSAVVTSMLQHDQNFAAMQPNNPAAAPPPAPVMPPPEEMTAPPPVEAPLTPPENADYTQFYNPLSPYGNWVNVDGYGPCWQPTVVVVNSGWQPYCDAGHWAYTDYGWYWMSDYSWGWAPFHYGRWFHHNHLGWCWAPGHVWGPSWVSWRYSNDYCGWAPLAPGAAWAPLANHYCFVPWNAFRDHHLQGFAITGRQAAPIFSQTVAANRFVATHNTVINQGVSAARVAAATHQVVEPLRLRDMSRTSVRGGRAEVIDSNTRTLSVYRPLSPNSTTTSTLRPGLNAGHTIASTYVPAGSQPWNEPSANRFTANQTHSTATAPLILRGQEQISPKPAAPAPAPRSSLVVIGRQQNGLPQAPISTGAAGQHSSVYLSENNATQRAQPTRPAWYDAQAAPGTHETTADTSRATPWLNSGAAAPAAGYYRNAEQPAPAYEVQRSYSAPAQSYRSQPAPAYSAPSRSSYSEVPRSASPAPAYSGGGGRSAPAPSYSGGGSRSAPAAPTASSGNASSGNNGHR